MAEFEAISSLLLLMSLKCQTLMEAISVTVMVNILVYPYFAHILFSKNTRGFLSESDPGYLILLI
jgi:hypothetical protein